MTRATGGRARRPGLRAAQLPGRGVSSGRAAAFTTPDARAGRDDAPRRLRPQPPLRCGDGIIWYGTVWDGTGWDGMMRRDAYAHNPLYGAGM
eukprot:9504109-Pyramimonas_sp.AAC.2